MHELYCIADSERKTNYAYFCVGIGNFFVSTLREFEEKTFLFSTRLFSAISTGDVLFFLKLKLNGDLTKNVFF